MRSAVKSCRSLPRILICDAGAILENHSFRSPEFPQVSRTKALEKPKKTDQTPDLKRTKLVLQIYWCGCRLDSSAPNMLKIYAAVKTRSHFSCDSQSIPRSQFVNEAKSHLKVLSSSSSSNWTVADELRCSIKSEAAPRLTPHLWSCESIFETTTPPSSPRTAP